MKRQYGLRMLVVLMILVVYGCDESGSGPATVSVREPTRVSLVMTDRFLGIDITMAEDGDYERAFSIGQAAGAQVVSLSMGWDDIETSPMEYSPDPNYLAIANLYYPSKGVGISLMIGPIDTNNKRMPVDLIDKPFDDPQVIERFQRLLDYVFLQIPDLELLSLSIGNEVDATLGANVEMWVQYQTFFQATSDYAREKYPGLIVGVKAMYAGLVGGTSDQLKRLNQFSDVIMVTYYPLQGDFTVKDPEVVETDIQLLTSIYPNRSIFIMEAGYPSSSVLNSSEGKQAAFVREMFDTWDKHASQIGLISFTWLTDLPRNSVEELQAYYGLSDHNFGEFLRTLGLRRYEGIGEDKLAYQTLKAEVEARGW